MTEERLQGILERFPQQRVLVVGDVFLDRYLEIDLRLSEVSLETGLEAYQVVAIRNSPGAGGTVVNNLRALEVPTWVLTLIGDDGQGYDLRRELKARGVHLEGLLLHPTRFTPTYTKPMLREAEGRAQETHRLDIKNRRPLEEEWEERLIAHLRRLLPSMDAVIVADQVEERNFGVITDRVREELARLAESHPEKVFFADSRARIGEFRNMILKPNGREAMRVFEPHWEGTPTLEQARSAGERLFQRTGKPVFLTLGERGLLLFCPEGVRPFPAVPVEGEIDIVGAGDSTTAGIVGALCAGATWEEAALIGQLVASITIQQIGTTGTATREQVLDRFRWALRRGWPP